MDADQYAIQLAERRDENTGDWMKWLREANEQAYINEKQKAENDRQVVERQIRDSTSLDAVVAEFDKN